MRPGAASYIGHHLLRARGPDPSNPATPLMEWLVRVDWLWGKLEEVLDSRALVWRALRTRGQAVEELDTYWRLADETLALERKLEQARSAAKPGMGAIPPR